MNVRRRQRLHIRPALRGTLKRTLVSLGVVGLLLVGGGDGQAALKRGQPIPEFQMKTVHGAMIKRDRLTRGKLGVLFFSKAAGCESCDQALGRLQKVFRSHPEDLAVVVVAKGKRKEIGSLLRERKLTMPLVSGDKGLFKTFKIALWPTAVMTGPDGEVVKVIQGGSRHESKLLRVLAAYRMDRNDHEAASELFQQAGANDPESLAGVGYAHLKAGRVTEAEKHFSGMVQHENPEVVIRGREGLAEVMRRQGRAEEAVRMAEIVLKDAPHRAPAQLAKGQALFDMGKKAEAEATLKKAVQGESSSDFAWQKSEAGLALGNLQMASGKPQIALKSFQSATQVNPFFTKALSNQGAALTKMGEPEKAMEVLQKLKKVDPTDTLVHGLMRQAQASMAQKKDLEHQKYIDGMVKDLTERFKKQKRQKREDDWTSPIGAISVLGFQSGGGDVLMGRLGLEGVMKDELTRALAERNISVVDRAILDKVMEELKLGSSDLANPKTSLELGKLTAAHVIATGSYRDDSRESNASMRLVETETTDIFMAVTHQNKGALDPAKLADAWADQIAKKLHAKYPLQGRILKVKKGTVIINLGERHAVTKGMSFNVLSEGDKIDLGDGEVMYDYDIIGKITITKVRDKAAFAKIASKSKKRSWKYKTKIIQTE
ncbi:MAG: tetratricopeptide repeat protein [Magnetococcales bacterium]|nr:tetratricopeptide repeat protein [Magnetococcales bacterium]